MSDRDLSLYSEQLNNLTIQNEAPNNTLFELSLDEVCRSIDKKTLQRVYESCPVPIIFKIIWKILQVDSASEIAFNILDKENVEYSIDRGHSLTVIPNSWITDSEEIFEYYANTEETRFFNKYYLFDLFNVDLLFELLEFKIYRNQLYTIFQIYIQIKGFDFPKRFAEGWMQKEKSVNDVNDMYFKRIEEGLKLGIFLGDTGWYIESAMVLSYTYKIITTNWICLDQNLKIKKTAKCLTKWLFVLSECHNYDEAKIVLQLVLLIISIIEGDENNNCVTTHMYTAVSHHYFVLSNYNEAWSWIVKAVKKLGDSGDGNLRRLVLNHKIRVASAFNQLEEAHRCIELMHTGQQPIDDNIISSSILNMASYVLNDLKGKSYKYYYIALDITKSRFGFYNLQTANVFIEYANARYLYNDIDCDTRNIITMGIFIMQKIGLPYDNGLMLNGKRIKALILNDNAFN